MARILIVEDDPVSAQFIEDILEKYTKDKYASQWKLRVTKVTSAIEALEIMKAHAFELIVTDIMMAKMDGWEFIREIRKDTDHFELPIVVVSAIDGTELEYNSKRVGASIWFTKPLSPKHFANKVFKLIAER